MKKRIMNDICHTKIISVKNLYPSGYKTKNWRIYFFLLNGFYSKNCKFYIR